MDSTDSAHTLARRLVQAINEVATINSLQELLETNAGELEENSWAIISHLSELLRDTVLTPSQGRVLDVCLDYISKHGNPKELAYAYLESCEAFKSSSLYVRILPHLTQVLLKLPKRQQSLDMICDSLYSHIQAIGWNSDDYYFVESDTAPPIVNAVKRSDKTDHILHVVSALTSTFLRPMAKACGRDCEDAAARDILSQTLLQLLHYPLLYIHFDSQDELLVVTTDSIVGALVLLNPTLTRLMELSSHQISPDFSTSQLIDQPIEDAMARSAGCDTLSMAGIASLAHLIFCEQSVYSVPQVLSHTFKLTILLPSLSSLYFRTTNSVVALKLTKLLTLLLTNIENETLDREFFDLPQIKESIAWICWSMQFSELLIIRQSAARLLPLLCSRFKLNARFYLFLSLLNTQQSPEILSYVYSIIKDFIHDCWGMVDYQEGSRYSLSLMEKIFQVPDGDNGKLLDDLNKISAALNLARYLVTRDKKRTALYTKEMNKYIQSYIKPIGQCLKSELSTLQASLADIDRGDYQPSEHHLVVGDERFEDNAITAREATVGAISRIQLVMFVHDCLTESLNS